MKKLLVLFVVFALIFGMISCGGGDINTDGNDNGVEQSDQDFQNLIKWENEYKLAHPDATKEEIDQAWNEGMQGLKEWTDKYKLEHPGATDEEINQAFKDAWGE